MLGECLMSAPTVEKLEGLINEYYCSVNYTVRGNLVFNRKTCEYLDTVYVVRLKNGRYQLRRWIKDEMEGNQNMRGGTDA